MNLKTLNNISFTVAICLMLLMGITYPYPRVATFLLVLLVFYGLVIYPIIKKLLFGKNIRVEGIVKETTNSIWPGRVIISVDFLVEGILYTIHETTNESDAPDIGNKVTVIVDKFDIKDSLIE